MDEIQHFEDKVGQATAKLINALRHTEHIYHSDAGHGWLKVSKSTIRMLGLADKISGYSYEYAGQVYLEEDRDAIIYFARLFPIGLGSIVFKQFQDFHVKEINDGDESNIRSFPHYNQNR